MVGDRVGRNEGEALGCVGSIVGAGTGDLEGGNVGVPVGVGMGSCVGLGVIVGVGEGSGVQACGIAIQQETPMKSFPLETSKFWTIVDKSFTSSGTFPHKRLDVNLNEFVSKDNDPR